MGITAKNFTKKLIEKFRGTLYIPTVEHQIYSTEETVIGSYMGKPLYRKVFRVSYKPSDQTGSSILVQAGVPNIELLIKTGVSTNWVGRFLRDYGIHNNTGIVDPYVDKNTGDIGVIASGSFGNNLEITEIIVEYTKTTDTTTTSKVPYEPLTEYSTGERMIGFWIDGKPIYRKTVEVTVPAGQKTNPAQVNVPLSGWDKIIKIGGYLETDFGGHILPYTWGAGDAVGIDFWANKTSGITMFNSLTTGGVADVYIEYTKTTD